MPDVGRLGTENRKALLGCVKGKVNKWQRENPGSDLSQATNQGFFTECSQALGLAKADPKPTDQRARQEARRRCMNQKANEWKRQNPGKQMPQETIAANLVECERGLQKTVRPSQAVMEAAWPEADVDLVSGNPVTLEDVFYVHEMTKRGLPEYGGIETLRWSRRILRSTSLQKASTYGELLVPEFVDLHLGPYIYAELLPDGLDEAVTKMDEPAVLLPVDEGTLVLTSSPSGDGFIKHSDMKLVLEDVDWGHAVALGPSENKLRLLQKSTAGAFVGMDMHCVDDDMWLLTASDDMPWTFTKVTEPENYGELGLVFGWGAVNEESEDEGAYFDVQGDHFTEYGLTKAAMEFMLKYRDLSDMHEADPTSPLSDEDGIVPIVKGKVVFCMPLTSDVKRAFDITCKKTGLLVAVKPDDPEVLEKFRDGRYTGFSVGGRRIPAYTEEV